jgi:sugar lactone lactonase YvrE
MGWLALGLIALPFAAAAYLAFERLAPRLLQPVPEPSVEGEYRGSGAAAQPRSRRWPSASPRQLTALRVAAAVAALLVLVALLNRPGANLAVPAAAPERSVPGLPLPAPAPLSVQVRFGGDGPGAGQLHDPRDIAVDAAGNVYVADTGHRRVLKFRPDGSGAGLLTSSAEGAFAEPSSVAVTRDGLIVDDSDRAQLHKFDFSGQPIGSFDHDLGLAHPRGITVAPDGTIYVGDTANSRILKVAPDGSSLGAFNTKGAKLEQPTGVAIDEQGSVYSVEPAASRIQKFTADGTLQASFYLPPSVTVYPPRAAWIPGRGLVVSLPEQSELLEYGPAGTLQATFVPQPEATAPAPRRALGLAPAPDGASVWVVWNMSSDVTQLVWPS